MEVIACSGNGKFCISIYLQKYGTCGRHSAYKNANLNHSSR